MEFDENNKLKTIIRNLDRRIEYLESRIRNIVFRNDIYTCKLCLNYCTYDDEKCDYNIFCNNYICNNCIIITKNSSDNKSICKNNKCNKWICSDCIYDIDNDNDNKHLYSCNNCKINLCNDHYHNINEKKDNICIDCNIIKDDEIIIL